MSGTASAAAAKKKNAVLEELMRKLSPEQIKSFRKHFEMFDLNRDGVISAKELRKVSKQMGYKLTDEQVQTIIKENDIDLNGYLSFNEFLVAMSTNLATIPGDEQRKHKIRRRFVEYDKDGDGRVTTAEAHSILQKELGFSIKQTADLVDHYDINKDGHLDYEEFVKFYAKVSSRAEEIRQMFAEFDKDKNGSVSVAEAKPILRKIGFSDMETEILVAKHDSNNDGELQYEEFATFLWHC